MKVYYWPNVIALTNWGAGQVVAVAESLEEAITAAIESRRETAAHWDTTYAEEHLSTLEYDLRHYEHKVFDGPWAVCIEGRE